MARSDDPGGVPQPFLLQMALIVFFASMGLILVATYRIAPTVFAATVPLDRDELARHPPGMTLFIGAVLGLIALLIVGIARRWRWIFWIVLIASATAVLHLPVTLLQLTGALPGGPPRWYGIMQACTEVIQIAIAAWMVDSYRRGGVWGQDGWNRSGSARATPDDRASQRRRRG